MASIQVVPSRRPQLPSPRQEQSQVAHLQIAGEQVARLSVARNRGVRTNGVGQCGAVVLPFPGAGSRVVRVTASGNRAAVGAGEQAQELTFKVAVVRALAVVAVLALAFTIGLSIGTVARGWGESAESQIAISAQPSGGAAENPSIS